MILKNYSELLPDNLTENERALRKAGLMGLEFAIKGVKPTKLVENALKIHNKKIQIQNEVFDVDDYDHIYIVGGGKATAEMALILEMILTQKLKFQNYKGYINIPEGLNLKESRTKTKIIMNRASHPIPNKNGVEGVKKMMQLIKGATSRDLVFCLISGGGSALLPYPKKTITLENLQSLNSLLLKSGASIQEINAVRKHLSKFKGGNFAKELYISGGSTLIALIISDVIGDNLDFIASGPTVPDSTTLRDAVEVLERYNLWEHVSDSIRNILKEGLKDDSRENPKQGDPCFQKVHNYLIGSIKNGIDKIQQFLEQNDFKTQYFSDNISGEAKEFGLELFHIIEKRKDEINAKHVSKMGLMGSGELTVTIKGNGVGGRNQEMLLSFLKHCKDKKIEYNFLIIGANLDGIEGNSDAMGALVDNRVFYQAQNSNINLEKYLKNNDSNRFFKRIGTELITGPTGCNVNDLVIILLNP